MTEKYVVLELQLNSDGTLGSIINQYDERSTAESRYHQILMSASVSELPMHTAFMLTPDGYVLKSECYKHETEAEE